MPARRDIIVGDLRQHLGWISLLDVLNGAREFRYRVVGTLSVEYFLGDFTGKTVKEAFAPQSLALSKAVEVTLRKTADERSPVCVCGDAGSLAPGYEEFGLICLPLSDDGETANIILQAFVFDHLNMLTSRAVIRANSTQVLGRMSGHA